MKKSIFLLSTLALILALIPTGMAKKPAPALRCTIEYEWVRDNSPAPFPGHWEGEIHGDIEGDAVWPPGSEPMRFAGQTSHYEGRSEIYVSDVLVLVTEGHGSTTVRHGKNSVWRSSGTVTYAGEGLEDWDGRRVYLDGHFTWAEDGAPEAGSGTFRVN